MTTEAEIFAVDFAALAREIAMDIFPLPQILDIHRLSNEDWMAIQSNQRFIRLLESMIVEWNTAANTRERVKIKAATGLELVLENYIRDITDDGIPLAQRVEAGKFLARLGELDGNQQIVGGGNGVTINIRTGHDQPPLILEGTLASGSQPGVMSSPLRSPDYEDAELVSDKSVSR